MALPVDSPEPRECSWARDRCVVRAGEDETVARLTDHAPRYPARRGQSGADRPHPEFGARHPRRMQGRQFSLVAVLGSHPAHLQATTRVLLGGVRQVREGYVQRPQSRTCCGDQKVPPLKAPPPSVI